jgi:hypothetical protein
MRSKVAKRIQQETPEEVRIFVRKSTTIDYLRILESNAQNQGTPEQADELAREIDKSWWTENKHRFIK